jgi:hypothetical protein
MPLISSISAVSSCNGFSADAVHVAGNGVKIRECVIPPGFEQNLRELSRRYGAEVAWKVYEEVCRRRAEGEDMKVARALERNFATPINDLERRTKEHIDQYTAERAATWENEIFVQRRRLGNAELSLKTKETRTAREHERIAKNEITALLERLTDCRVRR